MDINKLAIDMSAGRPVLTYDGCSVIQDDDAYEILSMLTPPPDAAVKEAKKEAKQLRDDLGAMTLSAVSQTVQVQEQINRAKVAEAELADAKAVLSAAQEVVLHGDSTSIPEGSRLCCGLLHDIADLYSSNEIAEADRDRLKKENEDLWPYAHAHMKAANAAMNFGQETNVYGDDNPAEFETPEDATALIEQCFKEATTLRARVEKLEKVRDAAEVCVNNADGQTAGEAQAAWDGLNAALAGCEEVGNG